MSNILGIKGFQKGHVQSEEVRKKISKGLKGNINNLGKRLTEETKRKIGLANRGLWVKFKCDNCGMENEEKQSYYKLDKKHFCNRKCYANFQKNYLIKERSRLWKGGKSFEPYGLEFDDKLKEYIRKRDNYRCQECFRHQDELYTKSGRKYKLMVHHIDYDKTNNRENNLVSLCRNCHIQTNFSREDWMRYFNNQI